MKIERLGPYRIQEVIGRGGMGSVFRAVNEENQEEVAVKTLSMAYADDDHFRSRFESEIKTLMELDHPNIVRLIGHGEEDGLLFFAMELVKGKSLHELQKAGKRFDWKDVIGIAMDVCTGLQHAHYRGIIHRDIKPANLLQTESGTTKITDFGIAKFFGGERLTAIGGAIGTADYMSPEQARGQAATVRSDLFSLGTVMYAMLSGRPPFADKNVQSTIHKLTTGTQVPLRDFSPDTPPELEELINRLLEKKPEDRFGTAQALNRRLVDLLELIKADADAQTAIAVELSDDSQYELAPTENTVLSSPLTAGFDTPTLASSLEPAQPEEKSEKSPATVIEPEKTDYFKKVNRKKKSAKELEKYESQSDGPVWPYVVGMVVVLALIAWGISSTVLAKPSADELFESIASSELPKTADCDQFLKRFPDDERADDIREIREEIESRKLFKQLALMKKVRGVRGLQPIEVMLINAFEIRKEDPVAAFNRMGDLIHMYEGDDELNEVEVSALSAAFNEHSRLKPIAEEFKQRHRADGERSIQRANALADEGKTEAAALILGAVVRNLESYDWAEDLVSKAKQALAEIPPDAPKPDKQD